MTKLLLSLMVFGWVTAQAQASMQEQINRSALILKDFISGPAPTVPLPVLKVAKGIVILHITKGGLIFTGQAGDGVIVKRLGAGWSGPAALSTSGAGFGLQAGGETIDVVLVLTTDAAMAEFSRETEIKFGGEIKGTAGPDSTKISETWTPTAPVYVYSRSDGVFGGLAVKGAVISPESEKNMRYYGKAVTTQEILNGGVKPPLGAKMLLDVLKGK